MGVPCCGAPGVGWVTGGSVVSFGMLEAGRGTEEFGTAGVCDGRVEGGVVSVGASEGLAV